MGLIHYQYNLTMGFVKTCCRFFSLCDYLNPRFNHFASNRENTKSQMLIFFLSKFHLSVVYICLKYKSEVLKSSVSFYREYMLIVIPLRLIRKLLYCYFNFAVYISDSSLKILLTLWLPKNKEKHPYFDGAFCSFEKTKYWIVLSVVKLNKMYVFLSDRLKKKKKKP